MRLRLIEDDTKIARFVSNWLKEAGVAVDHAASGMDGLQPALSEKAAMEYPQEDFYRLFDANGTTLSSWGPVPKDHIWRSSPPGGLRYGARASSATAGISAA